MDFFQTVESEQIKHIAAAVILEQHKVDNILADKTDHTKQPQSAKVDADVSVKYRRPESKVR